MKFTQNKKIEQVKETSMIVALMLAVKSTILELLTGRGSNSPESLSHSPILWWDLICFIRLW